MLVDPGPKGRTPQAGHRHQAGQASVELTALLPLVALIALVLWQAALAGHAAWATVGAARAAARAQAIGGDPRQAARTRLPAHLRESVVVKRLEAGGVRVEVRLPAVGRIARLWHVGASAQMPEQSG